MTLASVVFISLVLFAFLTIILGWRLQRLTAVSLAALVPLAALWVLNFYAVSTNWQDVGGFIDCGVHCSSSQETAGMLFFYVPVIAGFLLIIALVSALWSRFKA